MSKNAFFINTLWILTMGFVIKILGLINRIIITRVMGPLGISLYILAFPTIMLFVNIASFSLNVTITKLVAESIKSSLYAPKKLIKAGIKISLIVSLIAFITLIILIKPLTTLFLKEEQLFYPLLTTIFLIPLVGISDTLKGYFNGIQKMNVSSIANLIEQIARISFTVLFLFLTKPFGIVIATTFCLLALSFGELISIIYSAFKLKKFPPLDFPTSGKEQSAIFRFAFPTTLSRLVGSISYFLEPIIYTLILSLLSYQMYDIKNTYTIINAYTIPLLTLGSFVSFAIATAIVPGISESNAQKNHKAISYYIQKALLFIIVPASFISLVLYFYSHEFMNLIYGVDLGADLTKKWVFFFIPYYLSIPFNAILQALGKIKTLFVSSFIFHILKLILIIVLALLPVIGLNTLLITTIFIIIINFLVLFYYINKYTNYLPSLKNLLILGLLFVLGFALFTIFKHFKINYLLTSLIIGLITLFLAYKNDLLIISSFKKRLISKD